MKKGSEWGPMELSANLLRLSSMLNEIALIIISIFQDDTWWRRANRVGIAKGASKCVGTKGAPNVLSPRMKCNDTGKSGVFDSRIS